MRKRPVGKDAAPLAELTSRRLQRSYYSRKDPRRDSRKRLQRRRRLNLKLASDARNRLSIAGCRVKVSDGWKHLIVRFKIFKKWQTRFMLQMIHCINQSQSSRFSQLADSSHLAPGESGSVPMR